MDVVVPESQPQDALKHPLVQALLNACFDCAIVVDAKTRIILKVNTQAEVLLGYKESEIRGVGVTRLSRPRCVERTALWTARTEETPARSPKSYARVASQTTVWRPSPR
jgi:PAS domain-containing protein